MHQKLFESQQIFHSQSFSSLVALVFYLQGGLMYGTYSVFAENQIADQTWDFLDSRIPYRRLYIILSRIFQN